MANEHLKALWQVLDETTSLLQKNLKTTTLNAAIETGENLLAGEIKHEDGLPDTATTDKLQAAYDQVTLSDYSAEELRQAWQLVLVKAIKADDIEPNKQVTPDAMASLATFMVTTFISHLPETPLILDPAVGTGNLLFAVMNQLTDALHVNPHGAGIDNDEDLLAFAAMSSHMQGLSVDLYHQDALDTVLVKDADIVVSDLPVGYYPMDERAKQFATAAKKGHSFAHHLLIEQGMRLVQPGGLGLFFVPSQVFQSDEAAGLTQWLAQATYFQGLLNLPASFFATAEARKSLLVLQRPGGNAKQAAKVLLGDFPELSDRQAFGQFVGEVKNWAAQNIE